MHTVRENIQYNFSVEIATGSHYKDSETEINKQKLDKIELCKQLGR